VPSGSFPLLFRGPNGFRFGAATGTDLRLTDEDGREGLALRLSPPSEIWAAGETAAGLWIMTFEDKHFRLRDEAGKVQVALDNPPRGADRIIAVSPDQTRLVIAWDLGPSSFLYQLVETASGKKVADLENRPDRPLSMAWSPDDKVVAASFEDGT